jgi:flagellar hook protein FlgE
LVLSDPIEFKLDFSGTTNYASAFEVKRVDQDGYAAGSLSGLSVDDKGIVRGQFTNGRTVVAGQLQLATFRGLGGLREVTNNTYAASEQSGDPLMGTGASGIYGSVRSNSVEEANTDMASELVRLMVQQRNYQANAQTIRTQVEILSVTIDVTR